MSQGILSPEEIQAAREHLGAYYILVNTGYRYVPYQQEQIAPALEDLEAGRIQKLAIFMPPGEAKSDWGTRAFAPWYLGKHPEKNAMVCSYSSELASDDFGTRIKERIQSSTHLAIFPDSRLTTDSRAKTHFRTIKGGDFYSNGYSGSIGGKRLDLFIGDDLIKNWDEANSELVQNSLFETYKGVIKDRMRPGGIMLLCAHRWTTRDVYYRILEHDGLASEGGDWTVLTLPAESLDKPGEFLWEEHHGKKHYLDFRDKDERTWWSKFQQNPARSESFWFRDVWLGYYDEPIPADRYNTYILIDPAGSKTKQSDYTSLHVWAAGQDRKLFLADWVFDKFDPGERVQMIMNKVRKWKPQQVIYEEYGLNNDTFYIKEKMVEARMDERFYPIPVGKKGPRHSLSKNERIRGIIPFFREGRIFLPRKFAYKQHNGQTIDLTKRFLDEEYSIFKGEGTTVHDDDLDNMSRLLEDELHINYWEPPPQEADGDYYQGSSESWESRY